MPEQFKLYDRGSINAAIKWVQSIDAFPSILELVPVNKRSLAQNRLYQKWLEELAEQGDMTRSEYTGFCKLHYGVPILRAAKPAYKEYYDEVIKPLPYDLKLKMMLEPFGFPVTREMGVKLMSEYLDVLNREFSGQGFTLTDPAFYGLNVK